MVCVIETKNVVLNAIFLRRNATVVALVMNLNLIVVVTPMMSTGRIITKKIPMEVQIVAFTEIAIPVVKEDIPAAGAIPVEEVSG